MKINKILLIHSAHYAADGSLVKATKWIDRLTVANLAELALPLLAAYTPKRIHVDLCDDYLEPIPWQTDAEVIGISAQVMQLERAVEIARKFRQRGKIVIMGGFLPTMHPEVVHDDVDALCVGEGDLIWPQMLMDIENGCLKKIYRNQQNIPIQCIPIPRYDLIKKDHFVSFPVQATRGCPYTCEYCSIVQFFQYTYRLRPVDDIVRDIQATGAKYIHFTDDNLMENRRFAKTLFRRLKDLDIIWGAQVTINVAKNRDLLDLAYAAGCRMLAIGIETLSQKNLNDVSKPFNKVHDFVRVFDTIQDSGIAAHALIVLGLPGDNKETFDRTLTFLETAGSPIAQFFIYTPYPGTPEGKRLLNEGRIIDHNLNHYRESYVVFEHEYLSSAELIEGYWYCLRRFYSLRSIIKRLYRAGCKNKLMHLGMNLVYWLKVKRHIVPVYFGRGN